MRHRVDHRTLGCYGSHRRAMLANMAASLFLNGQIQTLNRSYYCILYIISNYFSCFST